MKERKLLPNTDNAFIDEDGYVYQNGPGRKPKKLENGYLRIWYYDRNGYQKTMGLHRALAEVFIPKLDSIRDVVNHRDGDISNNKLVNLEWVTVYENNIHHELVTGTSIRKKLLILKNGNPYEMAVNLKDAESLIGMPYLKIWDHLKDNLISEEGYSFVYINKDNIIPEEFRERKTSPGVGVGIKIKDTFTNQMWVFPSLAEAARHFNTVNSAIYQAIRDIGPLKLLKKRYQVEYENIPFKKYTNDELLVAQNRGSKEVLAFDKKAKVFLVYESAAQFVKESQIPRMFATRALAKRKGLIEDKDLIFCYKTPENEKLMADVMNSPGF